MAAIELGPGASDNPLAVLVARAMGARLRDHPSRIPAFERLRGRLAIAQERTDRAVTIEFVGRRALVSDGVVGIPDATIRGPIALLERLPQLKRGPLGLPRLNHPTSRALASGLASGALRVTGLPGGLPVLVRFAQLLSVD